jgi:hypothetical protein
MAISLTPASQFRVEEDSSGEVQVPVDRFWGAQSQQSCENFPIRVERFRWGRPVVRALGILKKCAALANQELGQLPKEKVDLIVHAAQEVIDGHWDSEPPATPCGARTLCVQRSQSCERVSARARIWMRETPPRRINGLLRVSRGQFDLLVRPEGMTHPLGGGQ